MAHDEHHNPLDHPEVQNASAGSYIAAFVLALSAMIIGCILTAGVDISRITDMAWIAVLATIAGFGQLWLFFKLDLSRHMFWHTMAFVMTVPLFFIAVGLTFWMFHYLTLRTMLGVG